MWQCYVKNMGKAEPLISGSRIRMESGVRQKSYCQLSLTNLPAPIPSLFQYSVVSQKLKSSSHIGGLMTIEALLFSLRHSQVFSV
ncbi:hypothetical protein BTW10_10515 [Chromohalobacter japonicus]|uniref:Uncharacterized protein n=1 Tax=Chromohalobacter japonicus TaxID=223900 RepID=A0A1Q8TC08_9GAMM|nr:hypothetical protein BTW10_10515 [Chromohalobacter japonicus]